MLFASLYTSGSGVQAASAYLDVTSNNIANSTTTAFKTVESSFQDFVYSGPTGSVNASGLSTPGGLQLGGGAALTATSGVFTQGQVIPTGQPYDLAVNGNGFFQVTLADGTSAYTRDGSFTLNANGQMVTSEGYALNPPITVPTGTTSVSIGTDGTVTAVTPTGTQALGQITLTNFQNTGGLLRLGDNLFTPGPDTGAAVTGAPGTGALGTVTQGSLENSNVDIATELVNLIIAQGSYLYNAQALQAENETLQDTTDQLFPP